MFERCLYFNVNALARRVNSIWDEAFAEFGLSPSHAYLLRLVLEHPALTQSQITAELKLEKSTVTRFVTVLEEKGFLSRERQGREIHVFPTAKSYSIQQKLSSKGDELYQRMTEVIGQEELTTLVTGLRKSGTILSPEFYFDEAVRE